MKKIRNITLLITSILVLTACQTSLPPERPLNTTGERSRFTQNEEDTQREEMLPVLTIADKDSKSEMKLRSQTSRYINANNSAIEITLTSSRLAYCQNESSALGEGEEEIKITIKAKDGKTPIEQNEYVDNNNFEISAIYRGNKQTSPSTLSDITFSSGDFITMEITDINTAIVRGQLKLSKDEITIEGEYFTAICR